MVTSRTVGKTSAKRAAKASVKSRGRGKVTMALEKAGSVRVASKGHPGSVPGKLKVSRDKNLPKSQPKGGSVSDESVEFDWSEEHTAPVESSVEGGESKKGLSDVVRKLITSGVTSAFMTEEGIRSYLNDVKLPTDVISQILKGAKKSRDEVIGKAGNELVKLIRKIDVSAEFRKLLVDNKIKIHAEIDFVPKTKESAPNPDKESSQGREPEKRERDPNQTEFFES